MERIRIGNDIQIRFTVYRNGEAESFIDATGIQVIVRNEAYNETIPNSYSIFQNIVTINLDAINLTKCGKCRVILAYHKGGDFAVDSLAFELVEFSSGKNGTVAIDAVISVAKDGKSAYEVWEAYPGNEGKTEEDYFEWLQKPSIDASIVAMSAAGFANEKANLANEKSILANNAAVNADLKAVLANSAASNADAKATLANAAADAANNAAVVANTSASSANNAALSAGTTTSVYNVTVAIPLSAGVYYTKSTARAVVPVVSRKLGLVITYSTADKVWYSEKYIGSTVAGWTTESNWEQVPDAALLAQVRADLNEVETDLNKTTQDVSFIIDSETPFILSNYGDNVGLIQTSSGNWVADPSLHYLIIPVVNGRILTVTPGINGSAIAFLKSHNFLVGSHADFSSILGYNSLLSLPSGTIYKYQIPLDANYLYIAKNNPTDKLPNSIIQQSLNIETSLNNIESKIETNEQVLFGLFSFENFTTTTYECFLLSGNISINIPKPLSLAFYNIELYDINDTLLWGSGDFLLGPTKDAYQKVVNVSSDVRKIIFKNINSVKCTASFISDGALVSISKDNDEIFDISIPSYIYLRTSQEFSIWYRNIIYKSQAFLKGNYSIRCQSVSGGVYYNIGVRCTNDRFNYITPDAKEFDLVIRIIDIYTEAVLVEKTVHFIVKAPVPSSPKIVLIGDSFTDAHDVSKYIYTFLETDGLTPVSIGLNNANYRTYLDNAWSGYGISWFHDSESGYLRWDRPLSDAYWDAGWGENEEFGWTTGQSYSDLSDLQKSHGKTKNEFYNPSIGLFDFSYYMSTYHSGISNVDVVVFNIGLNDVIWNTLSDSAASTLLTKLENMVNSIHSFDANANVILCTVTNQPLNDAYTSNFGSTWMTAETGKARQEKWNKMLIDKFDTASYRNRNIYIAPTSANYDAENAIYTSVIQPNKYNAITEVITNDIHPNSVGAKYIADTIVNTIEGVI